MFFLPIKTSLKNSSLRDFYITTLNSGGGDIEGFAENKIFLLIFTCLFLYRICTVVMNVLIGLTVSRTDNMMKRANLVRLEKTARAFQNIEYLQKLFPFGKKNKVWTKIVFNLEYKPSWLNYIMLR